MFYWFSYIKHIVSSDEYSDQFNSDVAFFRIWNTASRLFTKWQWRHCGFYNYLPFPVWLIIGTLQCRRVSHCQKCLQYIYPFIMQEN